MVRLQIATPLVGLAIALSACAAPTGNDPVRSNPYFQTGQATAMPEEGIAGHICGRWSGAGNVPFLVNILSQDGDGYTLTYSWSGATWGKRAGTRHRQARAIKNGLRWSGKNAEITVVRSGDGFDATYRSLHGYGTYTARAVPCDPAIKEAQTG